MEDNSSLWLGQWPLQRYPSGHPSLRPWDAADEYLVEHVQTQLKAKQRVLIVNDSFGALALAFKDNPCVSLGDSYLSRKGLERNWSKAQSRGDEMSALKPPAWATLAGSESLASLDIACKPFDWVILKIPKSLALLKHYLSAMAPYLHGSTQMVAGMMLKYLRRSMITELERFGPTQTSLAKKKARLVLTSVAELDHLVSKSVKLKSWQTPWQDNIVAYPACYAAESIDLGSQFMIEHWQLDGAGETPSIVDLGCGSGILGVRAQQLLPKAKVTFLDESFLALESARLTYSANFPNAEALKPNFIVADGMIDWPHGRVDTVLCNPPFHQQNTVTLDIANTLFSGAAKHLRAGGSFWVVANRHLPYLSRLNKLFSSVTRVKQNAKFVVYRAQK